MHYAHAVLGRMKTTYLGRRKHAQRNEDNIPEGMKTTYMRELKQHSWTMKKPLEPSGN